ncbi:Rieske (2Fe-2S) protein [Aestuariispira insulae]|uniref:Nitrite reductase/ring-hydroxylating ferredoxin subunit n=1 Tax=Aestuariispira insulae TaxID=1461337 RepID=A0A3D9HXJ7_9PROT|nr:Rieske 2Fe-2S domain-containing protein [Aestuariispira insulae]RED54232.1 nitrite reductase/ring-hydroxylating ferredoxin subunit [Aestuariispira insulae]
MERVRFQKVASLSELETRGRMVVKLDGKQIVLFKGEQGVHACNNRCPHEGYPLVEGKISEDHDTGHCVLTCNWHNWKFDLESGDTLVGGDSLRRYPVKLDGDAILLDLTDPPAEEGIEKALTNLKDSFRLHQYDRMAREIARLEKSGGDPLEAVRRSIHWTHDHLEYGMGHAYAATADWIDLRTRYGGVDPAFGLVSVLEPVGHMAWDGLRHPAYPYPNEVRPFDAEALVEAIEEEDEKAAIAIVRGGLAHGLGWDAFEAPLARAALAHYAGFGHAAIYVMKVGQLVAQLGGGVLEPLLLSLTRLLVYSSREDLIPEFRGYAPALKAWDGKGVERAHWQDFVGLSVNRALDQCNQASSNVAALYDALLGVLSWNMLYFDESLGIQTEKSVTYNVNWLDFTHGLTFANAVRGICGRYPELWPQGLLQMACFAGRNAAYLDKDFNAEPWLVNDPDAFLRLEEEGLFDHGEFEFIISCHKVKVTAALRAEYEHNPGADWVQLAFAAVNRYLHSPMKRRHALRTAKQSLNFVRAEG